MCRRSAKTVKECCDACSALDALINELAKRNFRRCWNRGSIKEGKRNRHDSPDGQASVKGSREPRFESALLLK